MLNANCNSSNIHVVKITLNCISLEFIEKQRNKQKKLRITVVQRLSVKTFLVNFQWHHVSLTAVYSLNL